LLQLSSLLRPWCRPLGQNERKIVPALGGAELENDLDADPRLTHSEVTGERDPRCKGSTSLGSRPWPGAATH